MCTGAGETATEGDPNNATDPLCHPGAGQGRAAPVQTDKGSRRFDRAFELPGRRAEGTGVTLESCFAWREGAMDQRCGQRGGALYGSRAQRGATLPEHSGDPQNDCQRRTGQPERDFRADGRDGAASVAPSFDRMRRGLVNIMR
jgi:hypothetical protein